MDPQEKERLRPRAEEFQASVLAGIKAVIYFAASGLLLRSVPGNDRSQACRCEPSESISRDENTQPCFRHSVLGPPPALMIKGWVVAMGTVPSARKIRELSASADPSKMWD